MSRDFTCDKQYWHWLAALLLLVTRTNFLLEDGRNTPMRLLKKKNLDPTLRIIHNLHKHNKGMFMVDICLAWKPFYYAECDLEENASISNYCPDCKSCPREILQTQYESLHCIYSWGYRIIGQDSFRGLGEVVRRRSVIWYKSLKWQCACAMLNYICTHIHQ